MHRYLKYSDLLKFKKIEPKRCAASISDNVRCEYYQAPRAVTNMTPAGYTSYTKYSVYDIDDKEKIVRVSVRIPKYKDNDGIIREEAFETVADDYTDAAFSALHQDFCDLSCTFEFLQSKYPLGKNATKHALELLLPWAQKKELFPEYPRQFSYLWFVAVPYKTTTLTFCLNCSPSAESIYDICVGNDFEKLQQLEKSVFIQNKLSVCMPANYSLYQILKDLFPTARYYFDKFQLLTVLENSVKKDSAYKDILLVKQAELKSALEQLTKNSPDSIEKICNATFNYLLGLQNCQIDGLDKFLLEMESILHEQHDFCGPYFSIPEFRSLFPIHLEDELRKFAKSRGYEPHRFAYIFLSSLKPANITSPQKKIRKNMWDTWKFTPQSAVSRFIKRAYSYELRYRKKQSKS